MLLHVSAQHLIDATGAHLHDGLGFQGSKLQQHMLSPHYHMLTC